MGDAGDTEGDSSAGVYQSGTTYRYSFTGFTWTSEEVSGCFVDGDCFDETENSTITLRMVKGDDNEQNFTAAYVTYVPGTGHYYSISTGGVATKELKWIEASCS